MKTPALSESVSPAAHTPTPWVKAGPGQIFDIYGNEIANCPSYGAGIIPADYTAPWHMADSNALFIVRACNNHDAFRATLEQTLLPLAKAARILGNSDAGDDALRAYNKVRALLIESQIPSA